ncbi:hypothetical protein, conserved [Eimeria necatrix]|uniref:Phosphoglycerate mutase domain-containing protein n=1 Tax=Eimeria necatrix TaxID=51315 RepID=U6MR01_9EIME|nr:hypothetical protein, conserved [Eimeria necatrix]CDJ66627.1 hypothetical protein, conserved [Eimeria necatrix]
MVALCPVAMAAAAAAAAAAVAVSAAGSSVEDATINTPSEEAATAAELEAAIAKHSSCDSSSTAPHGDICINIHFLRHAEGTHNVGARDRPPGQSCDWVYSQPQHFDADLSAAGFLQARAAGLRMPEQLLLALQQQQQQRQGYCCCCPPAAVYTSSLRRTIRTAYETLKAALATPPAATTDTAAVSGEAALGAEAAGTSAPAAATAAGAAEPLDIPVTALEETREWAGGNHCCDGRHPLKTQARWASQLFKNISFSPKIEADPLPPTMPRESRQAMEERCILFLQRLQNLGTAAAAAVAAASTAAGKKGQPTCSRCSKPFPAHLKDTSITCTSNGDTCNGRASNGSAINGSCCSSNSGCNSKVSIEVMCVCHSAWTRSLFGLLSIFPPSFRGLHNCEWRSVQIQLSELQALIPKLKKKAQQPRKLFPFSALPFQTPGAPAAPSESPVESFKKVTHTAAAAEGTEATERTNHWQISLLSALLGLQAQQPLTILVYPPAGAPQGSHHGSPVGSVERSSQGAPQGPPSEAAAGGQRALHSSSGARQAAYERIKAWIAQQPARTFQFSTTLQQQQPNQQQQQHQGAAKKQLLTDGLDCIRHVADPRPGEPSLEIVEKEKVHRENCLILCLVPLISDLEKAEAELSLLSEVLLPTQAGAEACLRLDVLDLS